MALSLKRNQKARKANSKGNRMTANKKFTQGTLNLPSKLATIFHGLTGT
jgi:hypothetical protein